MYEKTPLISVEDLAARLAGDNPPLVLDVREDSEWQQSHINSPHVQHLPMSMLEEHLESLPQGRSLAVLCRVGGRSARVATFLNVLGYPASNVEGGMLAWVERIDPTLPTP